MLVMTEDPEPSRPKAVLAEDLWQIRLRLDRRPIRPWRFRMWSATITHGVMHFGEGVWTASTRERLLRKTFKCIEQDCLRNGKTEAPRIEIDNVSGISVSLPVTQGALAAK
jgi:hypothetical protein